MQILVCLVRGHRCEGHAVLDPGLAPVKRAPTHWSPQCPLPRGWASPTGVWLASQALTRSHTEQAAQAVHQSTETIGVADASGGVIKVDLGGASAIGSVSLVWLQDVVVDAVSRRGMVSTTPLLPEPNSKPKDRRGRKRVWHDL